MIQAQPFARDSESARWLHFLSRVAIVTVLWGVIALPVYFVGIGFQPSDSALGAEYAELMQAVRSPAPYRVFMVSDGIGWLLMGVTLLTLAMLVRRRAPVRALFIAACGIGVLTGSLGGFMRLYGISDIAAQYATAAPAQQALLLQSFLDIERVINAHFLAGNLIVGLGFFLAATALWPLEGFPRWLAAWYFVPGILPLLQFVNVATGAPFNFILLMGHIVIGLLALNAAVALTFWRASPALVSASANVSAGVN